MEDLELILNPEDWPLHPFLPVLREVEGRREHGTLVAPSYCPPFTVIHNSVFDIETLAEAKRTQYKSAIELLENGWRVD